MGETFALVFVVVGLFFFVLPIFLLFRSLNLEKKADLLEKENITLRDDLRGIVRRVRSLEKAFEDLHVEPERTDAGTLEASAVAEVTKSDPVPTNEQVRTEPLPAELPLPAATKATVPSAIETPPRPIPAAHEPRPTPLTPRVTVTPTHDVPATEPPRWADLEERLGANWLNKIGTAAFVIGVALLLNYSMHYLGPRGKIGLGYTLSTGFLVAGVLGEKKERYRIASRAVLGGGWALVYFTTYAMHNIPAVRLVVSPVVGFGLLFDVAIAMVAHSLRYHSEVTTGFAYLLAFTSVAVSHIPIGALIASALLAASLAVILRARQWYALEPFAIAATYIVHQLWVNQIYGTMGGRKPFPEFPTSAALLTAYWLIYLISYFLRREEGTRESQMLTASFLLNAFGYLAVLHYQAFHPEWRFWFLLATSAVYLCVSAYARGVGRRLGFILASTLGVALIVAAVPYRYSGRGLEIFWLIEAEALLIVGWRAADAHLRKLGWAATGLLAGYVGFHDLSPRFEVWQPPNTKLGWMLLALAVAFYISSRFKDRFESQADEIDKAASQASTVLATGFLLAAAWVALSFLWTGLTWMVIGVLLIDAGRRFRDAVLDFCGNGAVLLAVVRLLSVDMLYADAWHNITLRLITVSCSSALLYVSAHRGRFSKQPGDEAISGGVPDSEWLARAGGLPAAYTWSATVMVAVLLWNEVATAAIGLAWGLFGLALLEAARALRDDRPLILQGRVLLLASFARIFFADLNSTARIGAIPAPVLTVMLLAAIYFYAGFNTDESSPRMRELALWLGTISLAALVRFRVQLEWVAASWAAMAVVLYLLGRRLDLLTFREQSYAMAVLVGIRCAFDNFYQTRPWHFTNIRIATVVSSAVLLYILFATTQLTKGDRRATLARQEMNPAARTKSQPLRALLDVYPQHLFFFVPTILLTALLSLEVRRGFLTAAWGLEALVVFLAVLKMDERTYRWFSLLLFLLCVGRIVTVDVWNLDALGRIVSFMGLGAALLAVSFLYAKHREILRRVL